MFEGEAKASLFFGKRVLHVGCGGDPLPDWLCGAVETRLDIDERYKPDIVASMPDMGDIGQFDIVLSRHCLEHLARHDADKALAEFSRVLNTNGFVYIVVPDIQGVTANDDILFTAPCGPITGFDLIYGHAEFSRDNPYMVHKSGFTQDTLTKAMEPYFHHVKTWREPVYNLIGFGIK